MRYSDVPVLVACESYNGPANCCGLFGSRLVCAGIRIDGRSCRTSHLRDLLSASHVPDDNDNGRANHDNNRRADNYDGRPTDDNGTAHDNNGGSNNDDN